MLKQYTHYYISIGSDVWNKQLCDTLSVELLYIRKQMRYYNIYNAMSCRPDNYHYLAIIKLYRFSVSFQFTSSSLDINDILHTFRSCL